MNDPLGLTPEQRRAAEERVVARYEARLMKTMEIPPDRRSGPRRYDPIWPMEDGRIRCTEASEGIFVEEVQIERSYPDTVMVIVFRFFLRPECLYAAEWPVWHFRDLLEPEPRFNDGFVVHLGEWLAKDFKYRQLECRCDEPVMAGRADGWSSAMPRLASGEIEVSQEDREFALRVLHALELG